MKAYELSKYIELTGIFNSQNVYTVEVVNDVIYNIPSYWKLYQGSGIGLEIRIYYTKQESRNLEINIGSSKLIDCELEELTFDILYKTLFKIVGNHPNFNNWISKVREYRLSNIGL